jgi:hypothetical protein
VGANYVDLTTRTNYPGGYVLNISATEPRLLNSGGTESISPLATTGTPMPTPTSLIDDHWGYNTSASNTAQPTLWKGVTTTATQFDIFGNPTGSVLASDPGRLTHLWYGADVGFLTPADTYSTIVTILAQAQI